LKILRVWPVWPAWPATGGGVVVTTDVDGSVEVQSDVVKFADELLSLVSLLGQRLTAGHGLRPDPAVKLGLSCPWIILHVQDWSPIRRFLRWSLVKEVMMLSGVVWLTRALIQDILHCLYTQIIRQTGGQKYVEMFLGQGHTVDAVQSRSAVWPRRSWPRTSPETEDREVVRSFTGHGGREGQLPLWSPPPPCLVE